jgi:hypothetical protein
MKGDMNASRKVTGWVAALAQKGGFRSHSSSVRELRKLLDERDPNFQTRIDRAKGQCNNAAREALRAETALKLNLEDEHRSVVVRVIDGLPAAVDDLIATEPTPILWKLLLHHGELTGGIAAAELFARNLSDVTSWLNLQSSESYRPQLISVSRLFQDALGKVEQHPVAAKLYAIDHDIMGTYHPDKTLVTIHWMVIALIASNLGVSVEALTVVVVVHELAHAYTHAGLDIDVASWDTDAFSRTEAAVTEGVAQHYTEVVLKKLATRFPEAPAVFQKLLARQPEVYRQYSSWFTADEKRGEIMRAALLETRRAGIVTQEVFAARVREHAKRIGGTRKTVGDLPLA